MTLVPLYGFVEGDTIGLLVLAHEHESIKSVAQKLARSAAVRVTVPVEKCRVVHQGRIMNDQTSVADAGITALDRIDLVLGLGAEEAP